MDERALAFLSDHTDTLMVLDALEYGMDKVPASVRAYLDPVLFYTMNVELRARAARHSTMIRTSAATWESFRTRGAAMGFDVSILGFGDNVVDRYEHLGVMYPGGNAVNVAVYARRLGAARSAYMGIFGTDEAAEHVIGSLVDEGVELVRCRQELGENGASSVTVEAGERVFLGSNQGGIRGRSRYVLDRFALEYVRGFDVLHTGSYCFTERELPLVRAAGVPVSFDFSEDSVDAYVEDVAPFVDFAFYSAEDEASDEVVGERLRWLCSLGPGIAVVTQGERGSVAFDGDRFFEQPIKPATTVRDTMGAGDSFIASFLLGYLDACKRGEARDEAIARALDGAAAFAAEVCGIEGAWGHPKRFA